MPSERSSLIRALFDEYIALYARRDERLLQRFSHDFSGYVGSSEGFVRDREAWLRLLKDDFAQFPGFVAVEVLDCAVQELSQDICLLTARCRIRLPMPDQVPSSQVVRHVQVLRLEDDGGVAAWKIVHSSTSAPFGVAPREGEVYPVEGVYERNRMLEALVTERTRALAEAHQRFEVLRNTDELTGIPNRRHFDHLLAQAWERCRGLQTPLALLLLELDQFQQFNDHYGLLAGDACLQAMAQTLSQVGIRREGDRVARFGGELFAVLLPDSTEADALALAERLHQALKALALPHEGTPTGMVTAHISVASLVPQPGQDSQTLVRRADAALRNEKPQ